MSMLEKLPPEVGMALLDIVVDMSDVPLKETLVARIREINGQKDPSKNPEDPEEMAKQAQEAEEQQKQKELMEAVQMLEIRLKEAQASKVEFEAADKEAKILPEVEKIEAEIMEIEQEIEFKDEELDFKRDDAAVGRTLERAKILADVESSRRSEMNPDANSRPKTPNNKEKK